MAVTMSTTSPGVQASVRATRHVRRQSGGNERRQALFLRWLSRSRLSHRPKIGHGPFPVGVEIEKSCMPSEVYRPGVRVSLFAPPFPCSTACPTHDPYDSSSSS